jgi:hypothetical protein
MQMALSAAGTPIQDGPHKGVWISINQECTVALSVPLRIAHDILNIPVIYSPADDADITLVVQTPSWQGTINPGLLSAVQELIGNCQPLAAYTSKVQYALAATPFQCPARHTLLRPSISRIQTETEYLQSRHGSEPLALADNNHALLRQLLNFHQLPC